MQPAERPEYPKAAIRTTTTTGRRPYGAGRHARKSPRLVSPRLTGAERTTTRHTACPSPEKKTFPTPVRRGLLRMRPGLPPVAGYRVEFLLRKRRCRTITPMALALDTSRQLRSIDELTQLVSAISQAPPSETEPDWLEWKREGDLSDRYWHANISKVVAGFSNRDPSVASRQVGDCAYLVIGAEPVLASRNVVGVSPVDNAVLNSGVSRYLRPAVRWSPQYIEHQGQQVLVITVELHPLSTGTPSLPYSRLALRTFQNHSGPLGQRLRRLGPARPLSQCSLSSSSVNGGNDQDA